MPLRLSLASLAAACLMLCSCLDYEEEMTLNKDLSGEVKVVLTLPDTLLPKYESVGASFEEAAIRKRFDTLSGVSLVSYHKSDDRKPKVTLFIKFTSLEKLNDAIAANKPASLLGGKFTISKVEGGTLVERKVGEGDPLNDLPEHNYVQYKTHYEGAVSKTNTESFDKAHNDIRYRYSLIELLANPKVQTTELTSTLPWKWILISLAVLGGAAYYGWEALGKKKRVQVKPAPTHAQESVEVPAAPAAPATKPGPAPATKPGPAPKTAPTAPPAAPPKAGPAPAPAPPTRPGPGGPPRPQRPGPPGPRPPGPPKP